MKKYFMLMLLMTSFSVFAQYEPHFPVFPYVYNNISYVQVTASNNNNNFAFCSGSVYMNLEGGASENRFVTMNVFPHGYDFQNIYPTTVNARIRSVNHSIFCN